jgi:hypothetical protein
MRGRLARRLAEIASDARTHNAFLVQGGAVTAEVLEYDCRRPARPHARAYVHLRVAPENTLDTHAADSVLAHDGQVQRIHLLDYDPGRGLVLAVVIGAGRAT